MITFEMEDLEQIDISMAHRSLFRDLVGSTEMYSLYLVPGYDDDDMPTRSGLQIIHSDRIGRAGVVLIEGGVAGRVDWIEAYSPGNALDLFVGKEPTIWFCDEASSQRSNHSAETRGENAAIPGSAGGMACATSAVIHEISFSGLTTEVMPNSYEDQWKTSMGRPHVTVPSLPMQSRGRVGQVFLS